MYTPPFDHESNENTHGDDHSGDNSTIPPRQSAVPYKLTAKQHKVFYTDEHPEVPKIRRASLKKPKVGTLPEADPEAEQESYATASRPALAKKSSRQTRAPFSNPATTQPHESSEHTSYPRQARKKARHTMLPLAGLDSADEVHSWQSATSQRKLVARQHSRSAVLPVNEPEAEELMDDEPTTPKRSARPYNYTTPSLKDQPSQRQSRTKVGSPSVRTSPPYPAKRPMLARKRTWVILGALGLLLVIVMQAIFHSPSAPVLNIRQNPTLSSVSSMPAASPRDPHDLVITPPNTDHPAPPVFATSAYLLDEDHETTLYVQNPFMHLPMLSTTKLMTATIAVEKGNLDQQVTISPVMQQEIDQLSADSALFGVKQGQTYTLRDLIYGLLYTSGNDAALVIANAVGGNVANFVAEMNQQAQLWGLHDTHFVNPHGLLDPGQYSCAHDLAILGQNSLHLPTLQQISNARTYHIAAGGNHGERALINENQFLWWYPGATGGKTGYDGVSDFVQVISVTRDNHHLIGVVMHTDNWWTDMRDLMDYGSSDYTWTSPRDVDDSGHPVPFDNLWHFFASDTTHVTVPAGKQGRYYVYTGYTVSGAILTYFDQQGGLAKFGFPIKMPVSSGKTLVTQQFQQGSIQCNTATQQCRAL